MKSYQCERMGPASDNIALTAWWKERVADISRKQRSSIVRFFFVKTSFVSVFMYACSVSAQKKLLSLSVQPSYSP